MEFFSKPLRPHQATGLADIKSAIATGNTRVVFRAPTGWGKTVLGSAIVQGALTKGRRVIFCVPNIDLIDQTVQRFAEEGVYCTGVIQANHPLTDPNQPIQICSVQTLERRKIPPADVVIIDEVHKWFKFYEQWMKDPDWWFTPFVGLSATPGTKGLGRHFHKMVKSVDLEWLIENDYLSPFRVFAPDHPDLSKVRTLMGDYREDDLSEVMNDKILVGNIVDNWLKHGERRPTLCFAVDRLHAKALQMQFEAQGVKSAYVDAFTDREERKRIGEAFKTGEIEVVCNVGVLTTGIDWDVRCIILARPTKSRMLFVQIIGRGLRTAEAHDHLDKKIDCVIFDHSNTTSTLGFVTDIHFEDLDMGEKGEAKKKDTREAEKPPKECPQCKFLRPPKVKECPSCGFVPNPKSEIECEDGDLVEVTPEKLNRKIDWDQKILFIAGLRGYAEAHGYKEGWVANKYREKFGVWPNDPRLQTVPATMPTKEVTGWIRHSQIRFAHSQKKAARVA